MAEEFAAASDLVSIGALVPLADVGRSRTHWNVYRWDDDATSWVSRQLGGEPAGRRGFVQPSARDFAEYGVAPYEQSVVYGNLITNAGWRRIVDLAIAAGGQAWDSTHTRIGAGNGTGTAAGNSTDLTAASGTANRFFQPVSNAGTATSGTGTSGTGSSTLAFASTFGTADGNFAWNEFGIDQGTATGSTVTATLLNLKTSISQGTKASGQTWTATCTFTFTSS